MQPPHASPTARRGNNNHKRAQPCHLWPAVLLFFKGHLSARCAKFRKNPKKRTTGAILTNQIESHNARTSWNVLGSFLGAMWQDFIKWPKIQKGAGSVRGFKNCGALKDSPRGSAGAGPLAALCNLLQNLAKTHTAARTFSRP